MLSSRGTTWPRSASFLIELLMVDHNTNINSFRMPQIGSIFIIITFDHSPHTNNNTYQACVSPSNGMILRGNSNNFGSTINLHTRCQIDTNSNLKYSIINI